MTVTIDGTSGITYPAGTIQGTGYGPAVFAYQSAASQSITANTPTKITLDVESFDTGNCFASSRFTPNVAGYYCFNLAITYAGTASQFSAVQVYKNGSNVITTNNQRANANYNTVSTNAVLYMNGTTDYVEMYGFESTNTTTINSAGTSFSAFLVRGA